MDVQQKLDEIVAAVDGARSMPMSASCVVNRAELLAMLGEVREALPGSLAQAREVLGGRDQVVAEAREEAERILDSARAERGSLVSGTEVARRAQEEADRILAEARREAEEIRTEADDYVDSKLANFEVVLSKTIGSVDRGREKLLGHGPGAEEWSEDYAEDAPERTGDPEELRRRADSYVDARLASVSAVLAKTLEAVGRGRDKLRGHQPVDELAAHMAAQDGTDGFAGHTTDADYLAGLASTDDPYRPADSTDGAEGTHGGYGTRTAPAQPPAPPAAPPMPQTAPAADPYQIPQQAQAQQQYGYDAQQDPSYAHTAQPGSFEGYGGYGSGYGGYDNGGTDGYGGAYAPADAYGTPADPYAWNQQPQPAHYPQQVPYTHYPEGAPQHAPQQSGGQLEETSLFETSMLDLEQVREFERRNRQG
ncbi:ATP synthase F0 subunit B [Streptomyces cacaoi]|uniref:ATP synthase F0 subunit B n=1 Tax=Streptomyces cacaoi TaxID=1898 RepID=UPI0011F23423|nr:ATP synthase F0 subunit B [Streptomyces cacaoi]